MSDLFQEPEDATPLTIEEKRELIPSHIAFRSELNELEQENLARAQDWALVCDDTLFVKALPETIACLGEHDEQPPYPGAKPHAVVDERFMAGPGRLAELLRCAWKVQPDPKKKAKKPKA